MIKIITYLGIDWGAQRIGLAVADNQVKLALPYGVVTDWSAVEQVIEEQAIDQLVIGQPLSMRAGSIDYHQGWQNFIKLAKTSSRPVHLADERLTSLAADRLIGQQRGLAEQDAIAAMLILQTFLDQNAINN